MCKNILRELDFQKKCTTVIPKVIFMCLCFYFESLFLKTFTFEMGNVVFYLHHAILRNNGRNSDSSGVDKQQQFEY